MTALNAKKTALLGRSATLTQLSRDRGSVGAMHRMQRGSASNSPFGNALVCSEALECRGFLPDSPIIAGDEIMFMPGGVHEITPSQAGKPIRVQVMSDPAGAAALESQRAALAAKGIAPYFDLNHDDAEASFWPKSFFWRDGVAPGIYAKGEWSAAGQTSRDGKAYRTFSPVFHVDDISRRPARIICNASAGPNMGGLVNNPAFKKILPLWAKHAGASSDQPNKTRHDMNEEQIAALQAKNTELLEQLTKLKSDQSALKAKNESDALVTAQISAHEATIKANAAILESEGLRAKNAALLQAATTRAEADADRAIEEAVTRGAIAAKDEETKKSWKKMIIADPSAAALLAKQSGNPALGGSRQTSSGVAVIAQDGGNILKAYEALRCKQLTVSSNQDKIALSKEMAAIFASDISANDKVLNAPISAADVTDSNVGTLAGTLVAQRTLELFKLSFGNILKYVTTDFSDVPGNFGQTTKTRVEMIPAIMNYDPTLGTDGRPKGYVIGTPAEAKDVSVTLDQHKAVEIAFGANILASTVRNLFGEQSEGQAYALANNVIGAIYALFTTANFNYNAGLTVAAGSFGRNTFADAGAILNPLGMPFTGRFALLNSIYYAAVSKDSNLVNFAAFQKPGIVTDGELPSISKFQPLEAPNLPTTSNLAGVFGHKAATLMQARIPNDYSSILPGASYGNVAVVTDADMGLSTLVTQYVSHQGGYAAQRQALMYGVSAALAKAALLLLSSGSLTGTGAGTPDFAS